MADSEQQADTDQHHAGVSPLVLNLLEVLDNIAHVLVAIFFIILSGSVLVYACLLLIRAVPQLMLGPHESAALEGSVSAHGAGTFMHSSLELLSTLLFAVIVLELLKTIITYLKTHNIQAIMKEFLVVGIISSIRKILLVGAESSLATDPTAAYLKEAGGTVITIVGILLLIAGLIFLQRSEGARPGHAAGS